MGDHRLHFKDRLKSGSDFYLGLSEMLGHVDILVNEGRVEGVKGER